MGKMYEFEMTIVNFFYNLHIKEKAWNYSIARKLKKLIEGFIQIMVA